MIHIDLVSEKWVKSVDAHYCAPYKQEKKTPVTPVTAL